MAHGWLQSLGGQASADSRLAWMVIVGSLPLAVVGLRVAGWVEGHLRSPLVVAGATAGFGLLLWAADYFSPRRRDEYSLRVVDALAVGGAQALALIPGTSRSGITMTAALALGLNREAAARFSFLFSVPAIVMSAGWQSLQLLASEAPVDWGGLVLGGACVGGLRLHSHRLVPEIRHPIRYVDLRDLSFVIGRSDRLCIGLAGDFWSFQPCCGCQWQHWQTARPGPLDSAPS